MLSRFGGRVPCPEGKPYIESFFGSYKTEDVYRNEYNSLVEAVIGWGSYRDWGTVTIDYIEHCGIKARGIMLI